MVDANDILKLTTIGTSFHGVHQFQQRLMQLIGHFQSKIVRQSLERGEY
jgi:hypothetical protein